MDRSSVNSDKTFVKDHCTMLVDLTKASRIDGPTNGRTYGQTEKPEDAPKQKNISNVFYVTLQL